jgi:hypothetical protein
LLKKLLYDDNFIKQATLEQIKSLLTFIARSEHFCNGCWEKYLMDNRVTFILKRLEILNNNN